MDVSPLNPLDVRAATTADEGARVVRGVPNAAPPTPAVLTGDRGNPAQSAPLETPSEVKLSLDPTTGLSVVAYRDPSSGQVIEQIPTEAVLRMIGSARNGQRQERR